MPSSVTGLSPNFGPTTGGNMVEIDGSGFTGASAVSFGGYSAAYMVVSDAVIEATAPSQTAGVVDVAVTASGGTSGLSPADQYTYQQAPPVSTHTYIEISNHQPYPGEPVTFFIVVNGDGAAPTGEVELVVDQTRIGTAFLQGSAPGSYSAQANITLPWNPNYAHFPITAVYDGDGACAPSVSAPLGGVSQPPSWFTTLSSSVNPSAPGQAVAFTATVNYPGGALLGNVTFSDGSTVLGTAALAAVDPNDSQATFITSSLTPGNHVITAVYGGASGSGSTGYLIQTVQQYAPEVYLASSADPSTFGQNVTFTATLIGGASATPTGTVTFMDGSAVLGTGTLAPAGMGAQATFATSALTPGNHAITAVYGGDASFASDSSYSLPQTVEGAGAFVWTGAVSEDWNTAANWLVDGAAPAYVPGENDDVIFSGAGETDPNCFTHGMMMIHSLTMESAFTGTVTLNAALFVTAGMDMEGGAVNQTNAFGPADVTVAGAFNWAGGVLNAGNQLANLFLNGTATLGGTNLTTGDNLVLNGVQVDFNTTGSLTFNKTAGISVSSNTSFYWNSTGNIVASNPVAAGQGVITNAGTFEKTALAGRVVTSDLPFINTATLNIDQGTLAFDRAGPSGVSVVQGVGGNLTIGYVNTKATLEVDKGLTINAGFLVTASDCVCSITGGDITINGGFIDIGAGGPSQIGELWCSGSVTMTKGVYDVNVNLAGPGRWTQWDADTFTFPPGNTDVLTVTTIGVIPAVLPMNSFTIITTLAAGDLKGDFWSKLGLAIGRTGQTYTATPDPAPSLNYLLTP